MLLPMRQPDKRSAKRKSNPSSGYTAWYSPCIIAHPFRSLREDHTSEGRALKKARTNNKTPPRKK
jgi:hypothetical protein